MRKVITGFLLLVSCSDDFSLHTTDEQRTVAVPGGSCGQWQEIDKSSSTIKFVTATCGDGLSCSGIAYYPLKPADFSGRSFQTCLPTDALSCDTFDHPCPDQFTCAFGYGLPVPGTCIHTCKTTSDCPDSYQICQQETCRVIPCDDGTSYCPTSTHCADRICRPDKA